MSRATRTVLVVSAVAVMVATLAAAGWIFVGATILASSETLPGGWGAVWLEVTAVVLGGGALAAGLVRIATRRPKPLRVPEEPPSS